MILRNSKKNDKVAYSGKQPLPGQKVNRRVLKRKLKNSNPQSRSLHSQSDRTTPPPWDKILSKTRAFWHWAACGIKKTTQNLEVRQQHRKSSLKYLCLRICRTFNLRTRKQIRRERMRTNLNLTTGLRNTMSKSSDDSSTHPRQVTEWMTEIHTASEVADLDDTGVVVRSSSEDPETVD